MSLSTSSEEVFVPAEESPSRRVSLANVDNSRTTATSPLHVVPELEVEAQQETQLVTQTFHMLFRTKLGWVTWKQRESSLFSLFERAFGAARCEMKLTDNIDEVCLEVDVPKVYETKLEKFTKQKSSLFQEINKIHGQDPASTVHGDCKLVSMKKTSGSGVVTKSSLDAIGTRIRLLSDAMDKREREMSGILDVQKDQQSLILKRFEAIESAFIEKEMKVAMYMETVKKKVIEAVMTELAELDQY